MKGEFKGITSVSAEFVSWNEPLRERKDGRWELSYDTGSFVSYLDLFYIKFATELGSLSPMAGKREEVEDQMSSGVFPGVRSAKSPFPTAVLDCSNTCGVSQEYMLHFKLTSYHNLNGLLSIEKPQDMVRMVRVWANTLKCWITCLVSCRQTRPYFTWRWSRRSSGDYSAWNNISLTGMKWKVKDVK